MNGSSTATVAFTSAPATTAAAPAASRAGARFGVIARTTAVIIASIMIRSLWAPPNP